MALLSSSLRFARAHTWEWVECGLNLIFPWPESVEAEPEQIEPPVCQQCGYPYPDLEAHGSGFTCTNCQERKWHFQWARAGYRTKGQVLEAIIGFKYRDEFYRQDQLVQWLSETFDRHAHSGNWHAMVPVPLYHRRHRERGFNQAREIARGLGLRHNLPVLDCLYRYRETLSQARLERTARWENMTGAFRMKPTFDVNGSNLLLIDDVFTTGATVNACAQALRQAGAGQLAVLTIARS